jgi:hypothetical protein
VPQHRPIALWPYCIYPSTMIDPNAGLALFNTIALAGKNLYDVAQGVTKVETKHELMEIYDTLMNLKRQASDLEDENHELKRKLRFRSEEFRFQMPFYYENVHPERALCAKCYSADKASPMGEPYKSIDILYRRCLVCSNVQEIGRAAASRWNSSDSDSGGSDSWMR